MGGPGMMGGPMGPGMMGGGPGMMGGGPGMMTPGGPMMGPPMDAGGRSGPELEHAKVQPVPAVNSVFDAELSGCQSGPRCTSACMSVLLC